MEHRRKEDEILFRRQHDFDIRNAGQSLLEVQRGVSAGKAAAENQNSSLAATAFGDNRIGRVCSWQLKSSCDGLRQPALRSPKAGSLVATRLSHPPLGKTFASTSLGPQVPGSYS